MDREMVQVRCTHLPSLERFRLVTTEETNRNAHFTTGAALHEYRNLSRELSGLREERSHSYRCGAGGSCLLCKNEVQDLAAMDCQENGDLERFPGTNKSGPSSLTPEVSKAKRSSLAFLPGLIR